MTNFFKFIGEDESAGFMNGKIYLLTIADWNYKGRRTLSIISSLPNALEKIGSFVPYETCESFFENWERI